MPVRIRSRWQAIASARAGSLKRRWRTASATAGSSWLGSRYEPSLQFSLHGAGPGEGCLEPDPAGACAAGELVVDHLIGVAEEQQPVPGAAERISSSFHCCSSASWNSSHTISDHRWASRGPDHRQADDPQGGREQIAVGENGRVCGEQLALGLAAQPRDRSRNRRSGRSR